MKIRMPSIRAAALFSVTAIAGIGAPPAGASDLEEIDCGSSPFSIAGEGYQVDCERSTQKVREGESTGGTQMDVMTISSDAPRMFVTVVGLRLNATRLFLERRTLSQNFHDTFKGIEFEEWKGVGKKGGYETAEFKAVISGEPSQCIAIQRYSNPAWTGFKRAVVGMGCSPAGLDPVYAAVSKLRAPGD